MANKPKPHAKRIAFFKPFQPILGRFAPIWYVSLMYWLLHRRALNLKTPTYFTEKLQFLKLHVFPRDPLVIRASDRVNMREMLKDKKLSTYLIPSFGPFTSIGDIPWKKLPKQIVIKASHGPGMQSIILDKHNVNLSSIRGTIEKWLSTNYGRKHLEKQFSPLKKQFMIEKYLGVDSSPPLEYQLHVFHGQVKYVSVQSGQGQQKRYSYFLPNWTPFPAGQMEGFQTSDYPIVEPPNFQGMMQLAEKLASPFPYVRIDLFNLEGKIYLLALTFLPYHGDFVFTDPNADRLMGTWLRIHDENDELDVANKRYQ